MDFDINNYKHLFPEVPPDNEILNIDKDIEDQYWSKQPTPAIITHDFALQEITRIRQGLWILIKGVLFWIPGDYYFFLQYWNAMGKPPEFRLKRLKSVYQDIEVMRNPKLMGNITFKNRKDGETLYKMSSSFVYPLSSGMTHGGIGMQSMDSVTVKGSCWTMMKSGLNGLPSWFKKQFLSDLVSDTEIQTQIRFERKKDEDDDSDYGSNIVIDYRSGTETAYDSTSDLRILNLDEFAKWFNTSIEGTIEAYLPFLFPGFKRMGLMRLFSSPATTNGKWLDEAKKIWDDSDPTKINPQTGTTYSRLIQNYSNPLDGIQDSYDKYGDVDPQQIYDKIMSERESFKGDKLLAKIRAFPMPIKGTNKPDEDELFGATDNSSKSYFMNTVGIKNQVKFIKANKSELCRFGNLVYPNNVPYSGIPIIQYSDKMEFNDEDSRFCFPFPNLPKQEITNIYQPPRIIDKVIGLDPYSGILFSKDLKKQSSAAALTLMFDDKFQAGVKDCFSSAYYARPWHKDLACEDIIKLALFEGAMVQYEHSDGGYFSEFARTKGFDKWLLDSKDKAQIQTPDGFVKRKGDAPAGRGSSVFMDEGIALIDGITNPIFNEIGSEDEDPLKNYLIVEALEDLLQFDRTNAQFHHWTMALIQCLIGRDKINITNRRKPFKNGREIIDYLNT